ncbi:hypothetical protein B0H11DRAFT_2100905 [Mycena galericulata]|nr:hypothetical protein B0H11DRAFT_2100905 [Mycena galericulata]
MRRRARPQQKMKKNRAMRTTPMALKVWRLLLVLSLFCAPTPGALRKRVARTRAFSCSGNDIGVESTSMGERRRGTRARGGP